MNESKIPIYFDDFMMEGSDFFNPYLFCQRQKTVRILPHKFIQRRRLNYCYWKRFGMWLTMNLTKRYSKRKLYGCYGIL